MAARARPTPLLADLRAALRAAADPARAPAMQAYMKSAMPYWGASAPVARSVFRAVFAHHPFDDATRWRDDVLAIWRGASHREERYGALALAGHRGAARFRTPDALPMLEEMIVTGAWWDYVDDLATHRIGEILRAHPSAVRGVMLAWSRSEDRWKRRSAIICQVGARGATDLPLLYACIEPSTGSSDFFLRKAIGWALRQVAWYDPEEVVRWVHAHDAALSGLTKREALRNVPKLTSGAARRRRVGG